MACLYSILLPTSLPKSSQIIRNPIDDYKWTAMRAAGYKWPIDEFVSDGTLLLLNVSRMTTRMLRGLLCESAGNVTSKGGIALPGEIWNTIFEYIVESELDDSVLDDFCFVQATQIVQSRKAK